jgi:LL-diaminopimelate aminotransferase
MVNAFAQAGLPECRPHATLYIWQRVPDDMTSVEFAELLLDPRIALITTPGNWISENTPQGNPGEGFVRLALVPSVERCEIAAERIVEQLPGLMRR